MSSKKASAATHSDDIYDIASDDDFAIADDAAPGREPKSLLPALKPSGSLVPYEPAGLPVPAGGLGTLDAFLRAAEKAPPHSAPCFSAETGRPTCRDIIPNNGDNFKWNIYIFL